MLSTSEHRPPIRMARRNCTRSVLLLLRGWTAPREFIDLGHSGAKASRPALGELRHAARAGEIRVVMIAGLDSDRDGAQDPSADHPRRSAAGGVVSEFIYWLLTEAIFLLTAAVFSV